MISLGKILLIENFSADFYKARVPLAKFLLERGWDVYALIPAGEYVDLIRGEGIKVIEYELERKDKGLKQLIKLVKIYKAIINEYQIDVIHSFRFQPNLLNVLANFFNNRRVFLHITGLGIAFSNSSFSYVLLRWASQIIFQVKLFRANQVIVQNNDDAKDIWFSKLWKNKVQVINGSGVNTSFFSKEHFDKSVLRKKMNVAENSVIFICVTRLLWEKGIREMVDAFLSLKKTNSQAILWIVGWSDKDNPRHVEDSYIQQFKSDDTIRFLGKQENVLELLAVSDVFLYPSYYREGIPRGILEALSMSLPIITTDMPGCKMTVIKGKNGYLIEPRSTAEISEVVKRIIEGNAIPEMGIQSRDLAIVKFADSTIFCQIESLYK